MNRHIRLLRQTLALAAGLALVAFSGVTRADPPGRVARLGYVNGQVSFSPAGEDDWGQAAINRPLTTGDRLWADAGGRAELQVGGAMVRLSDSTAVSVLSLDDDVTQLQLTEGSLNVRVRRLEPNQFVEVDTPNLAFTLRRPGAYRIDVDPDGTSTVIRMREGEGEAAGESGSYLIQAPQVQRFSGDAQRDEGYASAPPPDDFDRWAGDRDRVITTSVSARYVSPDVVGYEDLDNNGDWSDDQGNGHVWYPRHVTRDWAPYRDGHWAWVDPWGWTWVDDAPWGFAVSHYGRWAHIRGRWGWVPGPVQTRAYYAPALVVFVGGPNFSLKISSGGGGGGGVAWFPLGPREVYHPAYKVSPRYFEQVNVSNTVVNKTVIKNVYVTKNVTNITYVNRRVPGAVVAVPQETFKSAQPVAKATIRVSKEAVESHEVAVAAPVAPTEKSLHAASATGGKPPARAFTRQVVARTAPPPPKPSFASQQAKLAAQPGKPLDDAQREEVVKAKPATTAAAASAAAPTAPVKVVKAKPADTKTLSPQSAKASEPRGLGDEPTAAGHAASAAAPAPAGASAPRTAAERKAERQARAASAAEGHAAASAARPGRAASAAAARAAASAAGSDERGAASAPERSPAKANKPPAAASAAAARASAAAARRAASAPEGRKSPMADEPRSPPPAPNAASAPKRTVEERQAARAAQRERAAAKAKAAGTTPATPPAATSAQEPEPAASHPKRKKREEETAPAPRP